jgi:hypothetical protein
MAELKARLEEIAAALTVKVSDLQELGIQLRAMQGNPFLAIPYDALQRQTNKLSEEIKSLRREQSESMGLSETLERRREQLLANIADDPRAHILHLGRPVNPARMRFNRLAELWAAVSISALLLGFVIIWLVRPDLLLGGALVMVVSFILLDALLRGTYVSTINTIAVLLALAGVVILVIWNWEELLVGSIVAAAIFLLVQKVRELRS